MTTRVTLEDIANRGLEREQGKGKNGRKRVVLKKRVKEVVVSDDVINESDVEMVVGDHLLMLPKHDSVVVNTDEDMEVEEDEGVLGGEEYSSSILAYLLTQESPPSSLPPSITPRSRALLVSWLAEVHSQFHLSQDTLYLTVRLLDSYLTSPQGSSTATSKLQLVGVTALLLAAKVEEVRVPLVSDCCYVTDSTYTAWEVRAMERKMLEALEWRLTPPLPTTFLTCYTRALATDRDTVAMAEYFMELGLKDHAMVGQKPSRMAAAALVLAIKSGESDFLKSSRDLALLEDMSGARARWLQPLVARMERRWREAERGEEGRQEGGRKYGLGGS